MILQFQKELDRAKLSLIMSVADLYFKPDPVTDKEILQDLSKQYPEYEVTIMELMPAWKRIGFEVGQLKGREEGMLYERQTTIQKLLTKGFTPEEIARTLEIPLNEIKTMN